MLQTLFARCLAVSLAGASAAALLGLLHLAAGRTLGVKWQYYSWLPMLLVMLAAPLLPLPEAAPAQTASQAIQQVLPPAVSQIEAVQATPAAHSPSPVDWMLLLSILWLAGAAVVLLRNISSYREVLRGVTRAGVPLNDGPEREQLDRCLAACGMRRRVRLCRSAAVDTPLLAGVFRPVIVLPDTALSPEDLRHIFSHELTHCRRNDLAYKWLAVLACALHWFNPAVYLMLRSINRLCELSCDQCVIAGYDAAERRQYMQTILRMLSASVGCRRTVTTAMSAGGRMIEKRLRLIQRNRQIRRSAKYAGAVLTVLLTVGTGILSVTACAAVPERQAAPATAQTVVQYTAGTPDTATPAQEAPQPKIPIPVQQAEEPDAVPAVSPVQTAAQETTQPAVQQPASQPEPDPQPEETPPEEPAEHVPDVPIKYTELDGERANFSHNFSLKPGVDLDTIRVNAERGGRTQNTDAASTDLTRSYQVAEYAVEGQNGAQQTVATVTPDENGIVTVYLDSEYADWLHVDVVESDIEDKTARYGPSYNANPTRALSFGGLEAGKSYDVVIESTNDTDYTITGTAIVY